MKSKAHAVIQEMLIRAKELGLKTIELRNIPIIKNMDVSTYNIDIDVKSAHAYYVDGGERAMLVVWSEEDHKMNRYFEMYTDDIVRWYILAGLESNLV